MHRLTTRSSERPSAAAELGSVRPPEASLPTMTDEPRGAIFILVSPDGQMLLQLRDQHCPHCPGRWCFPGGACEGDEEYVQAVVREAKEEYAAELDPSACHLLMSRLGGPNKVYVCRISSPGSLRLHEGADMRWCSLDEVQAIPLGFDQGDILPELRKFLQGGTTTP